MRIEYAIKAAPLYAAKFRAETVLCEPPDYLEPTDENLTKVLGRCSFPPPLAIYPLIRQHIESYSPETLF